MSKNAIPSQNEDIPVAENPPKPPTKLDVSAARAQNNI
jgi:hypothetical protein